PCKKCRDGGKIEWRNAFRGTAVDMAVANVDMAVMPVRQVDETAERRNQAQRKTDDKTNQIDVRPAHTGCSFKTCNSRSASPGVSRISATRMKHRRESS